MKNIINSVIFIIGFIILVFGPIIWFISPRFIRSLRFYRIAKKYHLNFVMQKKIIHFKYPFQRNILTGKIDNHNIEIYDIYENAGWDPPFGGTRERESTRATVDGLHQKELEYISNKLKNLTPLSKIKKFLSILNEGRYR